MLANTLPSNYVMGGQGFGTAMDFTYQLGKETSQVSVRRMDGSEDRDSKIKHIERIKVYKDAPANNGVPWKDLVRQFCILNSSAYQAIEGSNTFNEWEKAFFALSASANAECTNYFGQIVRDVSIPNSPLNQASNCLTYSKNLKKLVQKKLGGKQNEDGSWEKLTKEKLAFVDEILDLVARDAFTSIVYPAKDYAGEKKFAEASRMELATHYQKQYEEDLLSMSCANGIYGKRITRGANNQLRSDGGPQPKNYPSTQINQKMRVEHCNDGSYIQNFNNPKRKFKHSSGNPNFRQSNNNNNNNNNNDTRKRKDLAQTNCYACGETGHISPNCKNPKKLDSWKEKQNQNPNKKGRH